jgi:glutathione synthase/RimK-type ligase-like ATP-grasp enzyme
MKSLKRIIYSWVEQKFLGGCSNYNSLSTRKNCRSKKQAREMFLKNNIPLAMGEIFYGPVKPFRFVKKYGFPVVVKPNVSGFSRGSYFPINSYYELLKAIVFVKIWWPSSVIEQYLEGKNYRIVVIKDDIMSVIRRYPPFVIGDGRSSISELIDRENKIRRRMKLNPVIHSIKKSSDITRYLKKQKLSFSSVLLEGEMVTLYNRISLAPGGVIETLDKESMHEQNRELFLKILPLFNANILGIDAIFEKGIDISYTDQRVIFLEVNSRPYLKMHDYPRYGEKQDLSRFYTALNHLVIQQKDIY